MSLFRRLPYGTFDVVSIICSLPLDLTEDPCSTHEGTLLQALKARPAAAGDGQIHVISHQVVKVAVLNCEPSKERMLLSFKLLNDSEPKNESVENSQKKGRAVNIGQVPGQVIVSYGDSGTREVLEPVEEKRGGSVRFGGASVLPAIANGSLLER